VAPPAWAGRPADQREEIPPSLALLATADLGELPERQVWRRRSQPAAQEALFRLEAISTQAAMPAATGSHFLRQSRLLKPAELPISAGARRALWVPTVTQPRIMEPEEAAELPEALVAPAGPGAQVAQGYWSSGNFNEV